MFTQITLTLAEVAELSKGQNQHRKAYEIYPNKI